MKCIAILSSVPDVVFFTADDEYLDRLDQFAEAQGMEKDKNSVVNMDALQMQFLPIFASLEMLEVVESPMTSFDTQDGHTCVIRQFDDYLYVGIADAEPKEFVLMQLTLLRDLLNMLYGPVTALLRPSNSSERLKRWKATSRLMSTVAEQRKLEQCYLVQAIEKIRINPHVQEICRASMETAIKENRVPGSKAWGSHAMLLVGTKLLSLYSHPTAPSLQTCDLFLLGLFVQDVLDRKDVPGLDVPQSVPAQTALTVPRSPESPAGTRSTSPMDVGAVSGPKVSEREASDLTNVPIVGRESRASSNGSLAEPFFAAREPPSSDGGQLEVPSDARSEAGSANRDSPYYDAETGADNTESTPEMTSGAAVGDEVELRELRREAVFLHTPNNNYAPYIMHCAEVAPSIALVVLSEGHNSQLSDLLHLALNSLQRIQLLGNGFQRRQRSQDIASEIPDKIHMAIRGSTNQACGYAEINGNYYQLADLVNGRRAFQRTSMDLFLYYNDVLQSWCLGQELPDTTELAAEGAAGKLVDTSTLVAMVPDDAASPENIQSPWEVYDHDLREFTSDPNLQIRCVRGDGALRNRDGHWSKQSTNGLFYCGELCPCVCGGCNGFCGPRDGCNCAACKALEGSAGYGALELALLVQREEDLLKSSAAESERALRKEGENLADVIRKICVVGANLMLPALVDQLKRRVARLLETVQKKEGPRRWVTVTEIAEGLSKTLRVKVGEPIATSNQTVNEAEEACISAIQRHVAGILKDYVDFLHVKIHRNVTMTAYLEMYPGLVHFIYVDRNNDTMIAPCLTSISDGANANVAWEASGHADTLKQKVWEMHAQAQQRLAQGYTSFVLKAADFRYSFYLWFENEAGEKLSPKRDIGTARMDAPDPSFFRTLKSRLFPSMRPSSVRCYELYLIHLARVPGDFAARQSEALVKELRGT